MVQAMNIRGARSDSIVEEIDHDQDAATSASVTLGKRAKKVLISTRPGVT